MTIAIIYASKTGNTQKVAEAIFTSLPYEKVIAKTSGDIDITTFDIILIGYWCYRGFMDPLSLALVKKIQGKKVGAFGTAGVYPDSPAGVKCRNRIKEIISQNNIFIGDFLCQGKIPEERTLKRMMLPKNDSHYLDEEGIKRHLESRKHPNEVDLKQAQNYFLEVI